MKKYNNLIVFATYWNEIDWIEPSLKQIEKLNPKEIIICDGCFDPSRKNVSTDGTRKIIDVWVSKHPNARRISAIRVSKLKSIYMILKSHNKMPWYYIFSLSRLKSFILTLNSNIYRVNQALTFQHMISLSKCWKPNVWTTNIDCDQFYSDDMIKEIMFEVNNQNSNLGLLSGKENSFFENFNEYTNEYDLREYNNMPHKIYSSTTFMPTRATIIENFSLSSFDLKKFFYTDFYYNKVKSRFTGNYNHYKFKFNKTRFKDGYALGDRKMPDISKYAVKNYIEDHPSIIKQFFTSSEK
jgi:hypothetical protein